MKINVDEADYLSAFQRGRFFSALEDIERYFRYSGLSIRDFDDNLYGCFCAMYLFDPMEIDDNSRFLPNSWNDLSAAAGFFHLLGEVEVAGLLEVVVGNAEMLRKPEYVTQVGFEDFTDLRRRGVISSEMEASLTNFSHALYPDLSVLPWATKLGKQLTAYARDGWPFEAVSKADATAWLLSEVARWSESKRQDVLARLLKSAGPAA